MESKTTIAGQTKPIIILYHLFQAERWEQIFAEQIGALYLSGLVEAATEIIISVTGKTPISTETLSDKFSVVYRDNGFGEYPTLVMAREKAFQYPDAQILYFHSKGISHPSRNQDDWRMMLQYFTIIKWKEALAYLNDHDVVTQQWRVKPVIHPSGNYWWANAEYLQKLDPDYMGGPSAVDSMGNSRNDRSKQEFWLGTIPAKVKNMYESNMNHYTEEYPPNRYTKAYYKAPPFTIKEKYPVYNREITPMSLREILQFHNINGHEVDGGTDKETFHSYGDVYEHFLLPLRDKEVTLMEVGVQYGGSMLLWHDLLPKANFVFLDIKDVVHPSIFEKMDKNRYTFSVRDAYTQESADYAREVMPQGFDVIIDDGPHTLQSQMQFISLYLPLLRNQGVAIIEDIQDTNWYQYLIQNIPPGFTYTPIDRRTVKGRYDDLMLVIKNEKDI